MVQKSGVWAHFGSWNFTKASINKDIGGKKKDQAVQILTRNYSLTEEESEKIYNELQTTEADKWIAGWPSYASGLSKCTKQDEILVCNNGLTVNLTDYSAYLMSQQGKVIPYSITYNLDNTIKERILNNSIIEFSVSLIEENGKYSDILMSKELAMSMFNRLYFYKGIGSDYFEQFSYKKDLMGSGIYVWRVNWRGNAKEILKQKQEQAQKELEEEMAEQSEQIRVSHILVNSSEEAEKILEQLKAGADFAELAKNKSTCPSASKGGDLGWFGKGDMVKAFEYAAFALENVGDLSDVIETEFGYHIIKLAGRREGNGSI